MARFTRRVGRAVVAACLLAMAASTAAHASGEPAPVLQATSLTNGWSHFNSLLSAQYDSVLVRTASSIAVTDKNGADVTGVTALASGNPHDSADKTILTFTPDSPFTEKGAPYTATLTAHAIDQDATIADTIDTFTFKVDTVAPLVPRDITVKPDPAVGGAPYIVGPMDTLSISGTAADAGKSGIASVELHFFNPIENIRKDAVGTITKQRFDSVATQAAPIACGATCPASAKYSFSDALKGLSLTPGLWTVKVAAVDLAGNVSGESSPIQFLLAAAPTP